MPRSVQCGRVLCEPIHIRETGSGKGDRHAIRIQGERTSSQCRCAEGYTTFVGPSRISQDARHAVRMWSRIVGACMIHIDGDRAFSCQTPLSQAVGRSVTTIEGLSQTSSHPVQKAWLKEQVPQCGYCQSGQIMSAAVLLAKKPKPSRDEIVEYMSAHICRCGTYPRILRAIQRASQEG